MANDPKKEIDEQNVYIRDTLMSVAANFSTALKEAVKGAFDPAEATVLGAVGKDLTRSFNSLAKMSDEFALNQSRINKGLLSQKDIEKQIQSVQEKREILERKMEHTKRLMESVGQKLTEQQQSDYKYAVEALKVQEEMLEKDKESAKSLSSRVSLHKIGDELKKKFRVDEIKEMFTLAGLFKIMLNAAENFNKISVETGKNLGYGADNADRVAQNLTQIANNSDNLNVTLKSAAQAMSDLNAATGGVAEYSADTLVTQVMLTKQFGLTGEEAAGIYKFSALTGKASSQINDEMAGAFASTRNMVRGSANFKTTMAEVAKVSGQLAINFKNNPSEITKAVVQAQALGTTLENAKNQGKQLLEFSTSIENELEAELLTGQQLNLERARAAALMGDQVTVMKELANQGMTLEKFQNMNVIAQESFAKALGSSADALSDQLRKQKIAQEQGKSLAQITKEEALEAEKRQNLQDKFNAAVEKLQDFIGNMVAGPFGTMIDMLTQALDIVNLILYPFQLMYNFTSMIGEALFGWIPNLGIAGKLMKGIAGAAIVGAAYLTYQAVAAALAATVVGGIAAPLIAGAAAAAVTAAGFGLLNAQKVEDGIASPNKGPFTITDSYGATAITAKGDGIAVSPNINKGGGGTDLTPLIAAINQVRDETKRLYNKDTSINMDGKKVGTTLTQGSYKLA